MTINLKCPPVDNLNMDAVKGTAAYGPRINPITKKQQIHHGVDLNKLTTGETVNNKPVKAAADGTVIVSKMQGNGKGYGNYIVIKHSGFYTLHAHLNSRKVATGQSVKAGTVIGTVGSTGNSTGPHLHFGICTSYSMANPDGSSTWLDPLPYLKDLIKEDKKMEEKEVTTREAINIVQDKAGLDENTIQFMLFYKYGETLIKKLAKAMK